MRYVEEATLVFSIFVLSVVLKGWDAMKVFDSVVPLIAIAGFGLWAFGLMTWAIISLKEEGRLSKKLLASVLVLCALVVIVR
jgi:hypothetical protein